MYFYSELKSSFNTLDFLFDAYNLTFHFNDRLDLSVINKVIIVILGTNSRRLRAANVQFRLNSLL